MGQKYASQSISGYNSSPPPDDGTTVAANKITWSGIKTKLADALNTFIAAVNTQLVTALDYSATTTSVNYTTLVSDHQKPIECSGTITISLGDAATMAAGYQVPVFNKGTGLVTVTPITGTDTLNGTAGASVVLPPFTGALFCVNQAANGYNIQDASSPYRQGADIASASTVNLRTATGDYVNITGTTTITAITLDKGQEKTVQFSGALTLTNGASLILPGGASITTAAGDTAIFRGEASGVVRCITYQKGNALSGKQPTITTLASGSGTYTTPPGSTRIEVEIWGGGASGGGGDGANRGTGGGGGGYCKKLFVAPAATYSYSVAAAAVAVGQGSGGTAGNNTTFGTLTANGGAAGLVANGAAQAGVAGGTATGGDENIQGSSSKTCEATGTGAGSMSFGGDSPRGGFGGRSNVAVGGQVPGGGGSNANITGSSGAGAAGLIVIREYYN